MKAGKLRHQIEVGQAHETQSASGEMVVSFIPIATVPGSVEPLTGRDALLGNQPVVTYDTRIRLRWSSAIDGINAKWRLRHAGIAYDIVSVINIEMRNIEYELMCKSGANLG